MGFHTITVNPDYSPALGVGSIAPEPEPVPAPVATVPGAGQATSIVEIIARAARDPNVDIEKMERLLHMQEQIMQREAFVEFNRALASAQAEMQPIVRDAPNSQTNSRYARLETIVEQITPIRSRHGFSVSFSTADCPKPDHIRIVGELLHVGGHSKSYADDYPLDLTGIKGSQNKTRIHAHASTITYGRRYLTCMMFDLAIKDDDDDGNAAGIQDAPALGADGFISAKQRHMLEKRLQDAGGDLGRFCSYLKISDLERLPARRMNEAMTLIDAKAAEKTKKEKVNG